KRHRHDGAGGDIVGDEVARSVRSRVVRPRETCARIPDLHRSRPYLRITAWKVAAMPVPVAPDGGNEITAPSRTSSATPAADGAAERADMGAAGDGDRDRGGRRGDGAFEHGEGAHDAAPDRRDGVRGHGGSADARGLAADDRFVIGFVDGKCHWDLLIKRRV